MSVPATASVHLRDVMLWDGTPSDPRPADVTIEDGLVAVVLPPGSSASDEAVVVDLHGAFVQPGLVDMHVHLVWSGGPDPAAEVSAMGEQATTVRAYLNARRQLEAGITTIRDLGSNWDIAVSTAHAVDRGDLEGPTIIASGRTVIMTGGHDPFWGIFSDGADEVVRAVRHQAMIGAGVIKLAATGGVYGRPEGEDIGQGELTREEMAAAVAEAHRRGLRVAAHAVGRDGIADAVAAGVDTVEHGNFLDEETIAAMASAGTALCPTLAIYQTIAQDVEGDIPQYATAKAKTAVAAHEQSFRMALEAGLDIVAGTDAGSCRTPHPALVDELLLMHAYGMKAEAVMRSATSTAGRVLGRDGTVGVVRPGAVADLLVLDGSPFEDLTVLRSPRAVIRSGSPVRRGKGEWPVQSES
jgi:imidazolonepropionase-like amidohydrolase